MSFKFNGNIPSGANIANNVRVGNNVRKSSSMSQYGKEITMAAFYNAEGAVCCAKTYVF